VLAQAVKTGPRAWRWPRLAENHGGVVEVVLSPSRLPPLWTIEYAGSRSMKPGGTGELVGADRRKPVLVRVAARHNETPAR
jgi:hypothetical protein